MESMQMVPLSVGHVVAIESWWGEHWGIVGSQQGRLTLIANSYRRRKVTEEWLEDVIAGRQWRVVDVGAQPPAYKVVELARSKIGSAYDFLTWNCEDLVYWAHGLKPRSPQREAIVGLVSLASVAILVGGIARSA